jgi:hypothetical protein
MQQLHFRENPAHFNREDFNENSNATSHSGRKIATKIPK